MRVTAPPNDPFACAVCGCRDARLLSATQLASGAVVIVCGSHAVAHQRLPTPARTVGELRTLVGERRIPKDRRHLSTDELALRLASAFCRERRGSDRRRTPPS